MMVSLDSNQSLPPPRSSSNCSAPMPSDRAVKPVQSKGGAGAPRFSFMNSAKPDVAMTPKGRLMKNTQRQS